MTERQQIEQIRLAVKRQPGVDIGSLDAGVLLTVETAAAVYEITVVEPHKGLVNVRSTDMCLLRPTLGKLIGSSYDLAGEIMFDEWIGKGLYIHINFKALIFISNVTVSARIEGSGKESARWHYDVF